MPDACEGIAVLEIAYATIMLEMFLSTNTTNKNQKKTIATITHGGAFVAIVV